MILLYFLPIITIGIFFLYNFVRYHHSWLDVNRPNRIVLNTNDNGDRFYTIEQRDLLGVWKPVYFYAGMDTWCKQIFSTQEEAQQWIQVTTESQKRERAAKRIHKEVIEYTNPE